MTREFSWKHPVRLLGILIGIVIAWYLGLCLLHYLSGRPLWNDEECVFRSVKVFSPSDFFKEPLQALQVFPRVYLFLIRQFAKPFGFHLLALRFFSFVAMCAAFWVWLKIASLELKNKFDLLNFVLCWAGSAVLIYYSGELKQYSGDILSTSLFILFLYRQEYLETKKPTGTYRLALFLLPVLLLFSYPACFFIPFVGWNLFLSRKKEGGLMNLGIFLGTFLTVAAISYQFDMRLRPNQVLVREWGDYFISFASVGEFFKTLGEGTMNLVSRWFVERPKVLKQIGVFFTLLGFARMFPEFLLWIKERRFYFRNIGSLALPLYLELFFFGCLKKYPFTVPRTSLFFCPILLLLTVKALSWMKDRNKTLAVVQWAFMFYLVFVSVGISFFVFNKTMSFRPVLWGAP